MKTKPLLRPFRFILVSLLIFNAFLSFSTIWNVGPTHTYTTPNALYIADQDGTISISDGDTISIAPEEYSGTDALAAWEQNNLFIHGDGGRPHLIADGEYILGKGIWVCVGNDITVKSIEFSGATVPDENGAGIRLDGIGLTVRDCYFHDNENGILTSNPFDGDILIEHSEFAYNGFGDGFTHNLYIGHVNSFTMRFCYSHHTNVGHNVKSRANTNVIAWNRIMDEETGNSSRLIDLPNGGYSRIEGNLLMQGPEAINNNAVGYGLEGLSNPTPHTFYFVHNTVISKKEAPYATFLHIMDGSETIHVVSNIFGGLGTLIVGAEPTTIHHNYSHDDISHFNFVDEAAYDYNLQNTSPVIDSAAVTDSTQFHYVHPMGGQFRTQFGERHDVGAYEYISPASIIESESSELVVYPNPATDQVSIVLKNAPKEGAIIRIYDFQGKLIFQTTYNSEIVQLDTKSFRKGMYLVQIETEDNYYQEKLVLK